MQKKYVSLEIALRCCLSILISEKSRLFRQAKIKHPVMLKDHPEEM
jgi:hypothetical protein